MTDEADTSASPEDGEKQEGSRKPVKTGGRGDKSGMVTMAVGTVVVVVFAVVLLFTAVL